MGIHRSQPDLAQEQKVGTRVHALWMTCPSQQRRCITGHYMVGRTYSHKMDYEKVNDGLCEDGGTGAYSSECAYGSDCGDCPARKVYVECASQVRCELSQYLGWGSDLAYTEYCAWAATDHPACGGSSGLFMVDFEGHCSCCLAGSRIRSDPREAFEAFTVYKTWWAEEEACAVEVLNATEPALCDDDSITGQGCVNVGPRIQGFSQSWLAVARGTDEMSSPLTSPAAFMLLLLITLALGLASGAWRSWRHTATMRRSSLRTPLLM